MDPAIPSPAPRPFEHRDLFVDAVRVVAVLVVVVGHWSTTTVVWEAERIGGINALSVIPAVRPLTWLMQVMPLLFFVGGFSNAAVTERHAGSYVSYLQARLLRLMVPTAVFFTVWAVVGIVVDVVEPTSPNAVVRAAEVAALPLWFLGIYIVVVGLAPVMLRQHRSRPFGVMVALVAGAVIVDVVALGLDVSAVGAFNYAFVWLFAHQLGFWYRDGRLRAGGAPPWAMAGFGFGGLLALTLGAGYPVSMVGVPGQERWNTDPPSLAIIALTLWLVGLALVARPHLMRWVGQGRTRLVVGLNRRVLTMYLWHITALSVVGALIYPLGFPQPEVGSGAWWLLRPLWVMAVAPALAVLVVIFGRLEVHPRLAPSPPSSPVRPVAGAYAVFSLGAGVLILSVTGTVDLAGAGGTLVGFSGNPLLGMLHLVVGGVVMVAAVRAGAVVAPVTVVVVGTALVGAGWGELVRSGSMGFVAWNEATAVLHVVVGGLTLLGALGALIRGRHRARMGDSEGSPTGGRSAQ